MAGIAYSLLLTAAIVTIRLAVPADPNDAGAWLTDGGKRDVVVVALGPEPDRVSSNESKEGDA